jgi:cytoskeletal protein RodZ
MSTEALQERAQTDGDLPSVGAYLRKIRKKNELTIHQLATITKIRPEHISAIEDDEIPKDIPNAYYRGYIRCYCKFFGLDTEAILKQVERDEYQVPKSAHDEINAFKVRQMQGSIPRSNTRSGNKARDNQKTPILRIVLVLSAVIFGTLAYQHLPYLSAQLHQAESNDGQYDSIIHIS